MRGIDTNILARVIVRDDPLQAKLAEAALQDLVFISLTVLMETVWLLTSRFRMSRGDIVQSLHDIFSLSTVVIEQEAHVNWALQRFHAGAGFADMIHLIANQHTSAFLTFDKTMVQEAGSSTPLVIEVLS